MDDRTQAQIAAVFAHHVAEGTATPEMERQLLEWLSRRSDRAIQTTGVARVDTSRRDRDSLRQVAREVKDLAEQSGIPDVSERDAMAALAARALLLFERLQAVIDWADFALLDPAEFDSHGVRNLAGPVFDEARIVLAAMSDGEGRVPSSTTDASRAPGTPNNPSTPPKGGE